MFAFLPSQLIPQAYAQCNPGTEGVNIGDCVTLGVGGDKVSTVYNQPTVLINIIISNLFVVSGLILFGLIILSGYKFISGATKGKDEAKTIMTTAVAGLGVMFVAYWVVQIIEVIVGTEIIF